MVANLETWELEGVDLADLGAYIIENRQGWDVQPGRRGEPVAIPYRHGGYTVSKKYLEPNAFSLTIVVADRLQGGALPVAPESVWTTLQANQDRLAGLLYSDSLLDLRRGMADGTERQAVVEMFAATPWSPGPGKSQMQITCLFINSEATWRGLPAAEELAIAVSGSLDVGGNAPVGDSIWTVTQGVTTGGSTIEVAGTIVTIATLAAGEELRIDNGLRRTWTNYEGISEAPADAITKFDRANWIELAEAQANAVTLTGDITVDVNWYNRWL